MNYFLVLNTCYLPHYFLPVICYLRLAICYVLLSILYLPYATCYLQIVTCYFHHVFYFLLLVTCYMQLATRSQLVPCNVFLASNNLLFVTHLLLLKFGTCYLVTVFCYLFHAICQQSPENLQFFLGTRRTF